MISLMRAFSSGFPALPVRGFFPITSIHRHLKPAIGCTLTTLLVFIFPLLSLVDVLALPTQDTLNPSVALTTEPVYTNYAQKGAYENGSEFAEVPQWHYYDMFGNKIIDGFYLYGLSLGRTSTLNAGQGNLALHPFMRMWFSGLVQVADLQENGGIMAMIGDRVQSQFTPFSLNQTLFGGSRFDIVYKKTAITFLTNRISNTGYQGLYTNAKTKSTTGDWITGTHARQKFGEDLIDIGGTWVNLHHENGSKLGNPYSGRDSDPLTKGTYNGLSLYGLDLKLKLPTLQASGEILNSQEYLDGKFKPKSGMVATMAGHWNIIDRLRLGGEGYTIGSRFQTNFFCSHFEHSSGDIDKFLSRPRAGKYQYSLVEDNDDKDEYPENGRSRYLNYTEDYFEGDPDGPMPAKWDKDKNGIWDYEEDFLNYDADPPESKILFDRNNNGTPDEVEDDAYPDYTYVPGYYLPGERYWRYDDINKQWANKFADTLLPTHKGLAGVHLYTRFDVFQGLELTVGGIFDRSQEKTFQPTYANGVITGEVYAAENASNLYLLAHLKKEIARDKIITIDNFFRKVNDNIPNHTQEYYIDPNTEDVNYSTVVDQLDYRDMFANATRLDFSLFNNRGFNYTGVGKFEFQKHFAHLEFNYRDVTTSALTLINKCHYVIALPIFDIKDMFLIPKYKNMWEINSYGPRPDSLDPAFNASFDYRYRRNAMINALNLVLEWKVTAKTNFTLGGNLRKFNDFINDKENYFAPGYRIQFQIHDRYAGTVLVLTTGFAQYSYYYKNKGIAHISRNNPHGAVDNIDDNEIFVKLHCGF